MSDEVKKEKIVPTARFNYRKSSGFRVVRAEGAWGGITPRGEIVMNIFNERLPVPDFDEVEILEDGSFGRRVDFSADTKGIVREVEIALSMDVRTAANLANWLLDKVQRIETAIGMTLEEMEAQTISEVETKKKKEVKKQ